MLNRQKLTDEEVHERLIASSDALPRPEECETLRSRTAVEAARSMLVMMQLSLLSLIEKDRDP